MVMQKTCSFCGTEIEPGTGKMLVKKDGSLQHYCSSKCEKNAKMKRNPSRTRWTETHVSKKQNKQ